MCCHQQAWYWLYRCYICVVLILKNAMKCRYLSQRIGESSCSLKPIICRCATGESWQLIMNACLANSKCDPLSSAEESMECGDNFAFIYFVAFIFLCSFLVSQQPYMYDTHMSSFNDQVRYRWKLATYHALLLKRPSMWQASLRRGQHSVWDELCICILRLLYLLLLIPGESRVPPLF